MEIWFNPIGYRCTEGKFTSMKDWILRWFVAVDTMVSKMAAIAWHIKKCRSDFVFNNKLISMQLYSAAMMYSGHILEGCVPS